MIQVTISNTGSTEIYCKQRKNVPRTSIVIAEFRTNTLRPVRINSYLPYALIMAITE